MLAKTALALAAAALLTEQAAALNAHRHLHNKRAIETQVQVVTHWVTVTIDPAAPTPSSESTTTATPAARVGAPKEDPKGNKEEEIVIKTTTIEEKPKTSDAPSSSNSTPTPSSAPPAPAGGKRGLGYNEPSALAPFFQGSAKSSWCYNWDSIDNGLKQDVEYVPMLWGPKPVHLDRWNNNADASIKKGAKNMLSFNEPDNAGQAALSPAAAAAAHVQYMNPYSGKVRIGGPAITNSNLGGEGLDWLKQFMSACKGAGCAIDFCVTHWYHHPNAADELFKHLDAVHSICDGKPVWLTEFAPIEADDATIAAFLKDVLPRLDAVPYLEKYAYFFAAPGHLLSDASTLSPYGQVYASL